MSGRIVGWLLVGLGIAILLFNFLVGVKNGDFGSRFWINLIWPLGFTLFWWELVRGYWKGSRSR